MRTVISVGVLLKSAAVSWPAFSVHTARLQAKAVLKGRTWFQTHEASDHEPPGRNKAASDIYAQRMRDFKAVDFDEMVDLTVRTLAESPESLEVARRMHQYILVDEFQARRTASPCALSQFHDCTMAYAVMHACTRRWRTIVHSVLCLPTWSRMLDTSAGATSYERTCTPVQDTSPVQIRLIALLQSGRGQLTVVGDDAQSIYGWRGATNRAFHTLEQALGLPVTKISLEDNYRSVPAIVNVRFLCLSPLHLHAAAQPAGLAPRFVRCSAQVPASLNHEGNTHMHIYICAYFVSNQAQQEAHQSRWATT